MYGSIESQLVLLTNNGYTPISFSIPHWALEGTGYSVDLIEKVRALPPGEALDFNVTFDPTVTKKTEGKSMGVLHFNVSDVPV